MLNVFSIELKKIFSQKKTYVIWIVFILMLLLNSNADIIEKEHQISNNLNSTKNIQFVNQSIQNIKSRLSDQNISDNEKAKYEIYLKNAEDQLSNFNVILDKNTDAMSKLKCKIEIIKSKINEISEGKLITSDSISDYNKELRFLQYLYDNKIPESNEKNNSFKFMFNFFNGLFPILFILLAILLSCDNVSKDIEESTIKLILIQPISRIKIITGKYFALITSVITIILSTFLIFFIVIGLIDGIGNPSYPFISSMNYSLDKVSNTYRYIEGSGVYISSLTLLIKTMVLFLLISSVAASIGFMISVLSNTSTMSMSISIIINIGLTYMVFGTKVLRNLGQYIYTSYYNVYDVVSGKVIEDLNSNQMSYLFGIIQMIFLIIVTYGVSSLAFTNKDI